MWRDWTTHKHKETKFLSGITASIAADRLINERVSAILTKARQERSFVQLFSRLGEDHFRRMFSFLYAVVGGDVHLSEIEELGGNKMFWGEIDEVEEIMKEKAASLEVFILAHELGKLEVEHFYAHQIVKKEYRAVLQKLAEDFRLSPEDAEEVFHLVILHEKAIYDFSRGPSGPTYEYLVKYCERYGRDADDFLDLLLAAVFLSAAVGAELDSMVFFNFLSAERVYSPERKSGRLRQREEKRKKIERARLREAGLDGKALMELLGMKPGLEFGKMLAAVHAFAKGEGELPKLPAAETELLRRVSYFRTPASGPSRARRGK